MISVQGGLLGTDRRMYMCFSTTLWKPTSNNEMFFGSWKHCVIFSLLYFYLGLIHIEAISGANYRGVQL